MNLVLDIGNTLIKAGVFKKDEIIHVESRASHESSFIPEIRKKYPYIKKLIYSCVGFLPDWLEDLRDRMEIGITLDQHTPLPIDNQYKSKDTLGYDRIATAVGANNIFPGKDVLIIDAGTAITYDLVESKGVFAGGNIAPGLKMRFRSLKEFTSGLPLVKPAEAPPLIGKTTHEAIQSGVLHGMLREIEGTINGFRETYPELITVLTGGDAVYFEKNIKNTIFVVPNLNLIGLNRILNYNANQNSS